MPDHDAYWPEPVPPLLSEAGDALALMERNAEAGAHVIGIGTYTNLALLEAHRPGLLAQAGLTLMGGYTEAPGPGLPQWGPDVDWNVQQDTVAAEIVWSRCRPTIVPLHVTLGTFLREADLPRLEPHPLGDLVARQLRAHHAENDMAALGRGHAALPDDLLNFQYDPAACAVALGWPGASVVEARVRPTWQGDSLVLHVASEGSPVRLATALDGAAFNRHWLEILVA